MHHCFWQFGNGVLNVVESGAVELIRLSCPEDEWECRHSGDDTQMTSPFLTSYGVYFV